jgi:hypothetical protein
MHQGRYAARVLVIPLRQKVLKIFGSSGLRSQSYFGEVGLKKE